MIIMHLAIWYCTLMTVRSAVLDPSLYLAPSPPLLPTSNTVDLWSQPVETRITRDVDDHNEDTTPGPQTEPTTTEKEVMDRAETFWPSYGTFGLRSIHIPLTFRITGTYGGTRGTGVMASSYTSSDEDSDSYTNYGYSGLAGSSYMYKTGNTRIRLFGNSDRPSWSGWGNGKWGHYGKG